MKLPVAGFVLAGGKSRRMGRDKAFVTLDGLPLLEHALASLREVCEEVSIAGGAPDLASFAPVVPDEHPGCGPLGGILAALRQSPYEWNLFHAVDVPFVPSSVWSRLAIHALEGGLVGVMARVGGRVHPLCGAYHRRAADTLAVELAAGRWKVTQALQAAGSVDYIDFEQDHWFSNLNTPEDLAGLPGHASAGRE